MCGRYSLAGADPFDIRARFPVGAEVQVRRRFNVAPGDDVLAVDADRDGAPRGELLRWGLVPPWASVPRMGLSMINARVETVAERPAFRRAFERWRCLIVADGFYEWLRAASGPKRPFHIARADGALFAFAGLWSIWQAPDGSKLRTCTILTTAANAAIAPLHDRMPVILEPEHEAAWLDPATPRSQLHEMLAGLPPGATAMVEVSTAVNDARRDGPECLSPPSPPSQGELF